MKCFSYQIKSKIDSSRLSHQLFQEFHYSNKTLYEKFYRKTALGSVNVIENLHTVVERTDSQTVV